MCLRLPSPDYVSRDRQKVVGRDECRRGHGRCLVHNGGLDISLDRLYCGRLYTSPLAWSYLPILPPSKLTYIDNPTQRSNGIRPVDHITPHRSSILHDRAGDHDDILGGIGQLLDDQIHHLPETGIFVLEQLRDSEEEGCGFVGRKLLACKEEEGDLGQEDTASSRRDGRGVEDTRWEMFSSTSNHCVLVNGGSCADLPGRRLSGRL